MHWNALMGLRSLKGDALLMVAINSESRPYRVTLDCKVMAFQMPPGDARHLAQCLVKCADEIDPPEPEADPERETPDEPAPKT